VIKKNRDYGLILAFVKAGEFTAVIPFKKEGPK